MKSKDQDNSNLENMRTASPSDSSAPTPTIKKIKKEDIIILRHQGFLAVESAINELEEKYSKKFGCKVIILESNLEFVEFING